MSQPRPDLLQINGGDLVLTQAAPAAAVPPVSLASSLLSSQLAGSMVGAEHGGLGGGVLPVSISPAHSGAPSLLSASSGFAPSMLAGQFYVDSPRGPASSGTQVCLVLGTVHIFPVLQSQRSSRAVTSLRHNQILVLQALRFSSGMKDWNLIALQECSTLCILNTTKAIKCCESCASPDRPGNSKILH